MKRLMFVHWDWSVNATYLWQGGVGVAPAHLIPSSYFTTGGGTPESQFMVLVEGASGEHAEAGPTGLEIKPRTGRG